MGFSAGERGGRPGPSAGIRLQATLQVPKAVGGAPEWAACSPCRGAGPAALSGPHLLPARRAVEEPWQLLEDKQTGTSQSGSAAVPASGREETRRGQRRPGGPGPDRPCRLLAGALAGGGGLSSLPLYGQD